MKEDTSNEKYTEAVSLGHYDAYKGGLAGKHDNVRIYWEDQIRSIMFRPYLQALVDRKKKEGRKVRIVDLGAGTGEALRLLTSLIREEADLRLNQVKVLPYEMIEIYIGCDINKAMVTQGNVNYADHTNVIFRQADFSKGFPLKDEEPFDLYFCSYGSLSHIGMEPLESLLTEIVEHIDKRALIIGDWLGRLSIEWPCYWNEPTGKMLEYSMSWLPTRTKAEPQYFYMLYWTGDEIRSLVDRVANKKKARIHMHELFDCSIFVGRHVDTREYNEWVRPVRSAVNHLHEPNIRTDLENLKIEVIPVPEHDELNRFFATLQFCWNNLVDYCQKRLERRQHPVKIKNWRSFPPVLQMAVMTLDRVIDAVSWMRMGDPRANIIEPQLGYALRGLEMELQQGIGCGHSLVGIIEVRK